MANEKPIQKDIAYYMALPYTIQIKHMNDESGSYHLATVAELEGCKSHGDTPEEALKMVREAMEGYLEVKLEFGDEIPEPFDEGRYSGKWLQRVPKALHKRLKELAESEGVSFNQYCLYLLSYNIGFHTQRTLTNVTIEDGTPVLYVDWTTLTDEITMKSKIVSDVVLESSKLILDDGGKVRFEKRYINSPPVVMSEFNDINELKAVLEKLKAIETLR